MYKVFIDNNSIQFKKRVKRSSNIPPQFMPKLNLDRLVDFQHHLNSIEDDASFIADNIDPEQLIQEYFCEFNYIEAAGGLIYNPLLQKHLFIKRWGRWDIPKGKIEQNESPKDAAIREIQEECALDQVFILDDLINTYHVYNAYGEYWLKKTHWFIGITQEQNVAPQLDEDIQSAEWLLDNDIPKVVESTYRSNREVIEEYMFKLQNIKT